MHAFERTLLQSTRATAVNRMARSIAGIHPCLAVKKKMATFALAAFYRDLIAHQAFLIAPSPPFIYDSGFIISLKVSSAPLLRPVSLTQLPPFGAVASWQLIRKLFP